MDLLSTIRKEGSRGGRGDFKWSDVESSSHRENYLGHSLMAPVGRWQRGRDLGWYAKANSAQQNKESGEETTEERAARERKEEIKRVKEAEQDALAKALGFDVPPKGRGGGNANLVPLGDSGERTAMERTVQDGLAEDELEGVKGVGFGGYSARAGAQADVEERMEGSGPADRLTKKYQVERPPVSRRDDSRDEYYSRHRENKRRHRRRSRSRSRSPRDSHRSRRCRDSERDRDRDRDSDRRRHRSRSVEHRRRNHRDERRSRDDHSRSRSRDHHSRYDRHTRRSRSRDDELDRRAYRPQPRPRPRSRSRSRSRSLERDWDRDKDKRPPGRRNGRDRDRDDRYVPDRR